MVLSSAGGCTFTKVARYYADWIILGRLDDAFDLTRAQKAEIEGKLPQFLEFVDTKLIPDLIVLLLGALERTQDGLQASDLHWIESGYENLRQNLMEFIALDAGNFLMSLSDKQLKHFHAYLDERNADISELLEKSPKKVAEGEYKRQVKFLKRWLGDITENQMQSVSNLNPATYAAVAARLKRRQAFQNAIYEAVAGKPGAAELAEAIRRWGKDPAQMLDKEMAESYRSDRENQRKYFVQLFAQLSEKQRQHLRREVLEFVDSLRSIARPPTSL